MATVQRPRVSWADGDNMYARHEASFEVELELLLAFIIITMNETLENLKVQGQWKTHQLAINAIQFSPDKKYLASGDDEGLLVVRETATNKCLRLYKAIKSITCLKWDPSKPSLLFVGSSNGEINKIRISPKGAHYDDQGLETLPGWIHALCFNEKGTQVFIAQGNRLVTAYRADTLEKPWGPMMAFPTPTIEDGSHPLIRQLHWSKDMIIVCFFFGALGVIAYRSTLPFTKVWDIKLRPSTMIGGSALSPSGKRLVVFNMLDGLDWYGTLKQNLLATTFFDIGAYRFTDVALVDEETAIIGHSSGAVVIATYDENMSRVVRTITCLETPDPLQTLDFAVINGKLTIAGGSMPINDLSAKMVLMVDDRRDADNRAKRSKLRKCGYCLIQTVIVLTTIAIILVFTVPIEQSVLINAPIDTVPAPSAEVQTTIYTESSAEPSTSTRRIVETVVETERTTVIYTKTATETATATRRIIETARETTTVTHAEAVLMTVTEMQAVLVTHTEATTVTHTTTAFTTTPTPSNLVTTVPTLLSRRIGGVLYVFDICILVLCGLAFYTGRDGEDPSAELRQEGAHSCPAQTELDRIRAKMAQVQDVRPTDLIDDLDAVQKARAFEEGDEHPMARREEEAVNLTLDNDNVQDPEETVQEETRRDGGVDDVDHGTEDMEVGKDNADGDTTTADPVVAVADAGGGVDAATPMSGFTNAAATTEKSTYKESEPVQDETSAKDAEGTPVEENTFAEEDVSGQEDASGEEGASAGENASAEKDAAAEGNDESELGKIGLEEGEEDEEYERIDNDSDDEDAEKTITTGRRERAAKPVTEGAELRRAVRLQKAPAAPPTAPKATKPTKATNPVKATKAGKATEVTKAAAAPKLTKKPSVPRAADLLGGGKAQGKK